MFDCVSYIPTEYVYHLYIEYTEDVLLFKDERVTAGCYVGVIRHEIIRARCNKQKKHKRSKSKKWSKNRSNTDETQHDRHRHPINP